LTEYIRQLIWKPRRITYLSAKSSFMDNRQRGGGE
jgi:hypothetical protein